MLLINNLSCCYYKIININTITITRTIIYNFVFNRQIMLTQKSIEFEAVVRESS